MFSYTAYGLNISSAFALPELVNAEGTAELIASITGPVNAGT